MKWEGLDDLRDALRRLPVDLRDDSGEIVQEAAREAFNTISQEYGEHTGALRRGLRLRGLQVSTFGSAVDLVNTAPHAWLWDHGSEARHYITKHGVKHPTGKMWGRSSPPHTFGRASGRARRAMVGKLIAMMERHGLIVSGRVYGAA